MAKQKEKPKKNNKNSDENPKKKGGAIGALITLVALGSASFGTVFLLPGDSAVSDTEHKEDTINHEASQKLDLTTDTGYLILTPLTISLQNNNRILKIGITLETCLLYTSPSPRDQRGSRMPSSA